jgi:ATP-dependent Clp protease ATP-binding subunit ClpC
VVLLDEIEKAHPDVFNTLLQILEDGRLTDAQGKTVDFKNTVIIMTSNLGTHNLRKASFGFGQSSEGATHEKMRDRVHEELKRSFRPEFLNRIDEVIVFHELSKAEVKSIVDLMIRRIEEQLRSQDVDIELTDAAKEFLANKGYDPALGARPLRRSIQRLVEDPLSEKILWQEFEAGDMIIVDVGKPEPKDLEVRQAGSSEPSIDEDQIVFRKAARTPDHPPVELAGAGVGEGDTDAVPDA